jgi:hypothetical protein
MGMQYAIQYKKILQTFQSKTLRMITNAPWYVSNVTLHNDLKIPFVQAIALYATKYKKRTMNHNNQLISNLFHQSTNAKRLQKIWPEDLARLFQGTIDGWQLTQDPHPTYNLLITL